MRTSAFGACLLTRIAHGKCRIVFIEQACSGIVPNRPVINKGGWCFCVTNVAVTTHCEFATQWWFGAMERMTDSYVGNRTGITFEGLETSNNN